MATKTATRPSPRSSHSQSHSQSHRTPARSTTTPLSPPSRVPPSVGQPLPPSANAALRSAGIQTEVRTPSPNYFGLIVDPTTDFRDSAAGPRDNWSPPTSSILSFSVASPEHVPVDSNPDFEAFRKQSESSTTFNLSHGNLSHFASTPRQASPRPGPDRSHSRTNTQEYPPSPKSGLWICDASEDKMDIDLDSSAGSKINEDTSMDAPSFFDIPRRQSPSNMDSAVPVVARNYASNLDDRHPRLSLPQNKADPPSPRLNLQSRAPTRGDTLPVSLEDGPIMIAAAQLKDILGGVPSSKLLLLDLRVFPQFSQSRIQNALNLCIPTTLLKRPSFNLEKLQETFTNESDKAAFARWKEAKYIVVYDAYSSQKKDAISAGNTFKKFANEGWKGHSYILRGGFEGFAKTYPQLIDRRSSQEMLSSKISLSLGTSMPNVAPVAGGCMMPLTKTAANPFFSNIRQNQDLIGGVGQMDVQIPEELTGEAQKVLPRWLFKAVAKEDHGKGVSDKFLHIELDEQSRMTKALAGGVSYGTQDADAKVVQIAGVEKGGKNRYNNIWPFEHARVRLQGRPEGACDYVNASHIKSSRSRKRYIASQGPLPATFEDFWSVVWDQDVRVIVMLTAESEGGQLKCHSYWSNKEYGPFRLKGLSEKKVSLDRKKHRMPSERHDSGRRRASTTANISQSPPSTEQPHVIVRKFTLSHNAHPFSPMREITQIHYSSWPDFGAPASPSQLLALVELSNVIQSASSSSSVVSPRFDETQLHDGVRPMLVHCSAGCGRTGTFCTIDSVIDMLKRQRKESRAGVIPMEISPPPGGDYMSKGGEREDVDDSWMFDPDLDLVEKTVEDFRCQRLSMVQSLRQYVLCYETILEWVSQQRFGITRTGSDRSASEALGSRS